MTAPERTEADVLQGRVLLHLEEIEVQQASFDRAVTRLRKPGFVAAWSRRGTPEQIDDKGSLERAYEQIVNDLQGIFDAVEASAHRAGLVPDPQSIAAQTPDASGAWWTAADELGLPLPDVDRSLGPGRWRRLALYGHLDHELATLLAAWCDTRNLLQHAYARRTPERASYVWDVMQALRADLPAVVRALVDFRDAVASRLA